MQTVIFTDLDGTLLDYQTYDFAPAKKALVLIKKKKVPLIICTSKTKAAIEEYRKRLGNSHPFISENGGAIFIPRGYFDFDFKYSFKTPKYFVIEYGRKYAEIRAMLEDLRLNHQLQATGLGDMTWQEIHKTSNMPAHEARLSKKRDYTEPFISGASSAELRKIITHHGYHYTRTAKYHYIMGRHDKGKAVRTLMKLLQKKHGKLKTVALGDNLNDVPMLSSVDKPFLVQKRDGSYQSKRYNHAKGVGPIGWNSAIVKLLS